MAVNLTGADHAPVVFSLSDDHREQLMQECTMLVNDTRNSRDLRRAAFSLMAQLIRERSPAKVQQLEIAKFGRRFP